MPHHCRAYLTILRYFRSYGKIKDDISDSEIKARMIGVEATMRNFICLFGLLLGERISGPTLVGPV